MNNKAQFTIDIGILLLVLITHVSWAFKFIFMKLIYFARPVSQYDTPQDNRDRKTLQDMGFEILDPKGTKMQNKYEQVKKEGRDPMEVFEEEVQKCHALAFRSFYDHTIGAGVYTEVDTAKEMGIPIIELPQMIGERKLTTDETRERLRLIGTR